jgi:hypothetical protein
MFKCLGPLFKTFFSVGRYIECDEKFRVLSSFCSGFSFLSMGGKRSYRGKHLSAQRNGIGRVDTVV